MGWVEVDWIAVVVMAYLIGSIPSAYIAGRLVKRTDIRAEGDQNLGAENAYRTLGPRVGLAVGAADIGKGAAAVLLAKLTGSTGAEMTAGLAAVTGHNWSIFLHLTGGRGAAATVGIFLALIPIPAIPLSLAALALLPVLKSATLALSLILIPMPLLVWLMGESPSVVAYTIGLPIMLWIRHLYTSRKFQQRQRDQSGGEAVTQG